MARRVDKPKTLGHSGGGRSGFAPILYVGALPTGWPTTNATFEPWILSEKRRLSTETPAESPWCWLLHRPTRPENAALGCGKISRNSPAVGTGSACQCPFPAADRHAAALRASPHLLAKKSGCTPTLGRIAHGDGRSRMRCEFCQPEVNDVSSCTDPLDHPHARITEAASLAFDPGAAPRSTRCRLASRRSRCSGKTACAGRWGSIGGRRLRPGERGILPPVYLNDPYILAEDGLSPSEGGPQFQQMVYAVAMNTIDHFERLSRACWASRITRDEDGHVVIYPRLRI